MKHEKIENMQETYVISQQQVKQYKELETTYKHQFRNKRFNLAQLLKMVKGGRDAIQLKYNLKSKEKA